MLNKAMRNPSLKKKPMLPSLKRGLPLPSLKKQASYTDIGLPVVNCGKKSMPPFCFAFMQIQLQLLYNAYTTGRNTTLGWLLVSLGL
jgi:hypothetical protein